MQAVVDMNAHQPPPYISSPLFEDAMKTCTKCGISKQIHDFHKDSRAKSGVRSDCRDCRLEYTTKYNEKNRDLINERQREYNKRPYVASRHASWCREYYAANKERLDATRRDWVEKNKEAAKASARERQRRALLDPIKAEKHRMRSRLAMAVANKGFTGKPKTEKMLGCNWHQFIAHIESKFKDGMSWENRSKWHIDHITPLDSAKTIEELEALAHYTNTQPLWAKDNLRKGAKIDYCAD